MSTFNESGIILHDVLTLTIIDTSSKLIMIALVRMVLPKIMYDQSVDMVAPCSTTSCINIFALTNISVFGIPKLM